MTNTVTLAQMQNVVDGMPKSVLVYTHEVSPDSVPQAAMPEFGLAFSMSEQITEANFLAAFSKAVKVNAISVS